MAVTIPHLIPATPPVTSSSAATPLPSANPYSLFDVALDGTGFMYANVTDNPLIRETAQYEKPRIDQAQTPGENTLTNWWLKSQDSFHGGAGQLNLEPPNETPIAHIRYGLSKNIDPFTPGLVTRLPDTAVLTASTVTQVVSVNVAGADAVAVVIGGAVSLITDLDGAKTVTAFATVTSGILSIATDGARVYCASATTIYAVNPASPATAAVTVATLAATATVGPVLGWAKSRLLVGVNGAVYQVDVSLTGHTLAAGDLLFQHPTPGWKWRAFADSPTALLAAGDAGSFSEIMQFNINQVAGAPVLQAGGTVAIMPFGEVILSVCNVMGSFQAIGTNRGIRIGVYDSFYGRLSFGPLTLLPTDPTIATNAVVTRDRFAFAVGKAYDEGGLIAVDLGTTVDQAGRFAWAPHLIPPITTATAATCAAVLSVSSRIVFAIPGTGLLLEGASAGTGREAWLRTSRIRFGTTEPKLFKLGSIRGDITAATVKVIGSTEAATTPLGTLGFTANPPDFRLPSGQSEWLSLEFDVTGSAALLRSYAVKALPGTRRQRRIKLVLAIYDAETTRSGQNVRDRLKARDRLNALEALDAAGDEILFQEFTPTGVINTLVVVEQVTFTQIGRPTRTSDVGGEATVILRTVDQ